MAIMKPEEKLEAISVALRPYLNASQHEAALLMWAINYADKPTFALQHFVGECCRKFSIETARSQVLRSLVEELSMYGQRRGPEDLKRSASARPHNSVAIDALPVFQLVIEHICQLVGKSQSKNIRQYILANLERLPLDRTTRKAIEMWLTGYMPVLDMDITLQNMQLMVNLAYVALCEYSGPVTADTILHTAIQQVAQTPAAIRFSPKQLL